METQKKKKVLIGKFLVFPRIQLKYALVFSSLATLSLLIYMWVQNTLLSRSEALGISQLNIGVIKESFSVFNVLIVISTFILHFLVSIVVTHRFLGPIVGIKRGLDKIKIEGKFNKISIRKTDEIHALVNHINQFFEGWDNDKKY